jgi:hypothetical protein
VLSHDPICALTLSDCSYQYLPLENNDANENSVAVAAR